MERRKSKKGDVFAPAYQPGNISETLTDLNSDYTVVDFGASWCPACPEELSKIAGLYDWPDGTCLPFCVKTTIRVNWL